MDVDCQGFIKHQCHRNRVRNFIALAGLVFQFGHYVFTNAEILNKNLSVFVRRERHIIAVCTLHTEGKAFNFSVVSSFYNLERAFHSLVEEAFASLVLHLIGLPIGVNEDVIGIFIQDEAFRRNLLFDKVPVINQVLHPVHAV